MRRHHTHPAPSSSPLLVAGPAEIFAALMAGHQVGDHITQTDHQAARKADPGRAGWSAMAGHVAGYTATQAVALVGLRAAGYRVRPGRALAGLAFSAGTHAFIDRRWPVQWLLRHTGSPQFAATTTPVCGPYVVDQSLHTAAVFTASLVTGGARRRDAGAPGGRG